MAYTTADLFSKKKREDDDLMQFGDFRKAPAITPVSAGVPQAGKQPPLSPMGRTEPTPTPTPDAGTTQPQTRDFGASAIISLIVAAAGTAASAKGSSDATKAAEKESAAQRAQNAKQWDEQMAQETRSKNQQGLEYLFNQRQAATAAGRSRMFKRDLLRAAAGGY